MEAVKVARPPQHPIFCQVENSASPMISKASTLPIITRLGGQYM